MAFPGHRTIFESIRPQLTIPFGYGFGSKALVRARAAVRLNRNPHSATFEGSGFRLSVRVSGLSQGEGFVGRRLIRIPALIHFVRALIKLRPTVRNLDQN